MDELGEEVKADRLMERLVARYGESVRRGRFALHSNRDMGAALASGSHPCEAMAIVPCSMKTLAGVAHGLSRSLIERAADVMLKERRRLVLVPRETPMSLPQLRNMVAAAEAGALILPAMPAFYQRPRTIDDLADFIAGTHPERARVRAAPVHAVEGRGVTLPASSLTNRAPARIAGMFDAIAPRYDALNHLLSAGLDRGWRRRAVRELRLTGRERVLDMCTGTADLAIEAATAPRGRAREVVGIDFAAGMLRLGLAKVRARGLAGSIHLARGDATRVPLPDRSCDAALVAFGIRNVADPGAACREFARVLRPGSRLAILEFGTPATAGLRSPVPLVFPIRAAADRPARLETSRRLLVPSRLGGAVSHAGRFHGDGDRGRLPVGFTHATHVRDRVAVRRAALIQASAAPARRPRARL